MNCTKPRMLDPFPEFPRLRKPAAAEDDMVSGWSRRVPFLLLASTSPFGCPDPVQTVQTNI